MRLATFATAEGTSYGAVTESGIIDLRQSLGARYPDLRSLLGAPDGLAAASDRLSDAVDHHESYVEWLPVIPNPTKIVCVGLNYEAHRLEAGLAKTEHPAIFLRTPESQVGHRRPILLPPESSTLDYEAEIAIVIGVAGRRIRRQDAWKHIAGYSCYNDGSVREWQRHTQQYTAGKNFSRTGAFGPWMTTADEIGVDPVLTVSCRLNGELMQQATTEELIFPFPELVEYISTFTTLEPGDVIVTGTPAGVGSRREPPVWMKAGDKVEVEIDQVGVLENSIAEDTQRPRPPPPSQEST